MATTLNIDVPCEHIIGEPNAYRDEFIASILSTVPYVDKATLNLLTQGLFGVTDKEYMYLKNIDDVYILLMALETMYELKINEDYGVGQGYIPAPDNPITIKTLTCEFLQKNVYKKITLP